MFWAIHRTIRTKTKDSDVRELPHIFHYLVFISTGGEVQTPLENICSLYYINLRQ
jgi:hypothetical protein